MLIPYGFLLPLTALALASPTLSLALLPTSSLSPSQFHHPLNLTSTPLALAPAVPNNHAHCATNTTPFLRRKPRFTDCSTAIRQLPYNHLIDTFHTAGHANEFRLPVEKTSGTCAVRVELRAGFNDEVSSWAAVGNAVVELNWACVNTFTFPVKVGGWTTVGRLDRIRVRVFFPGMGVGEGEGEGVENS